MAKKHKNLDNIPIQWDGDIIKPSDGSAQSSPDNINIVWGGYKPCWYPDNYADCIIEDMYFEDFDLDESGVSTCSIPSKFLSTINKECLSLFGPDLIFACRKKKSALLALVIYHFSPLIMY